MSTASKEVTNMDTKGTHVSTSFTADPENSHITVFIVLNELGLVDRSDSELLLDSRDKGRSLEASTFKCVDSFLELLDLVKRLMKLNDSNVFFTS